MCWLSSDAVTGFSSFSKTKPILVRVLSKKLINTAMNLGNIIFEEGWKILKKAIAKLENIVEDLEPNFTSEEYMDLYTTASLMCPHSDDRDAKDYIEKHCRKYKETCEEFIKSKVLPSLQGKKDDLLLRELFKRLSRYEVMIRHLSTVFKFLNMVATETYRLPSLEKTSSSSFYNLVYKDQMNKDIMDAMLSVMERKLAGEKFDPTFVINTLSFYIKFYKRPERNLLGIDLEKKLKLVSSDGVEYEVDYGMKYIAERFEEITETLSVGEVDTFSVPKVSSKMLSVVYKFHQKISNHPNDKFQHWYLRFLDDYDRDRETLLDIATCACYMGNIRLEKLAWSNIHDLIKGKKPEEISQIFGAVDHYHSKFLKENNQYRFKFLSFN